MSTLDAANYKNTETLRVDLHADRKKVKDEIYIFFIYLRIFLEKKRRKGNSVRLKAPRATAHQSRPCYQVRIGSRKANPKNPS